MDIHNSEADCTCCRHYPQLSKKPQDQSNRLFTHSMEAAQQGGGERVRIGKEEVRREHLKRTTNSESLNTLRVLCVAFTSKGSISETTQVTSACIGENTVYNVCTYTYLYCSTICGHRQTCTQRTYNSPSRSGRNHTNSY